MAYRGYITCKNFCLIGDKNVGKTCWLQSQLKQPFVQQYTATMQFKGVLMHSFSVFTTKGPVVLNIWDLDGNNEFNDLQSNYYKTIQGFIAFFDITSTNSYLNVRKWVDKAKEFRPDSDVVLVGNKSDLDNRVSDIDDDFDGIIAYCKISAKNNSDTSNPILYLLRRELGEDIDLVK